MKRGRSERETCDLNGWGVGTRLAGDEGYGVTVIEITALGERMLLAKCVSHKDNPVDGREGSWTLSCRDWIEIGQTPVARATRERP